MTAHSSFITKCRDLSSKVAADLQCTTRHLEFSELFMQRLLATTRPETVLRQILNADEQDINTLEACYHALHVSEVGQAMASTAIATGNARALYNQYMVGVDKYGYAGLRAEDFDHEATVVALKRLRRAERSSQKYFAIPSYQFFAGYSMDIALDATGSLDQVLAEMSVIEIHAAAPWLAENGVVLFTKERMSAYENFPYYYLNHCSDLEMRPTFDLLSSLHGDTIAQKMIFAAQINSPRKTVFLKADDLAESFGYKDAVTALRSFIASKDEIFAKPLEWLIKGLRQEGRLIVVDALNKSESRYLLNQNLLELSELHALPRLTGFHSEKRFGADLGL